MLLLKSIIKNPDRSMLPGLRPSHLHSLSLRIWACNPNTRIYVRLLGPCFKTGHLKPFRQHPKHICTLAEERAFRKKSQHAAFPFQIHGNRGASQRHVLLSSVPHTASVGAITVPEYLPSPDFSTAQKTDVDLNAEKCTPEFQG
jgi:hypothetical protein